MAELKREYVVPLRRKCLNAPKWRRSKKAIAVLKDFMRQHMKCENVIVCSELNEHIWARGSKYPPGKVEVIALRTQLGQDEKVLVNLKQFGIDTQRELYNVENQVPTQEVEQAADNKDSVVDADVVEKDTKEVETKVEDNKESNKEAVEEVKTTTTTKKTTKKKTTKVVKEESKK